VIQRTLISPLGEFLHTEKGCQQKIIVGGEIFPKSTLRTSLSRSPTRDHRPRFSWMRDIVTMRAYVNARTLHDACARAKTRIPKPRLHRVATRIFAIRP
jgi:hypothetical protein